MSIRMSLYLRVPTPKPADGCNVTKEAQTDSTQLHHSAGVTAFLEPRCSLPRFRHRAINPSYLSSVQVFPIRLARLAFASDSDSEIEVGLHRQLHATQGMRIRL
jgi:hypothetical protein